jgi:serine/threonine protein kinase
LNSGDPDVAATVAQFKNQAQVSASLKHPGIVEVYEFGEDAGVAFLALEFVEGCYLRPQLRLPIADASSAIIQLLEALDYAHQQRVLHLDIHPACLLLTSKGRLRVTDFGIAEIKPRVPLYAAPERLSGLPVDGRSDIFSAGAWFYETLTGTAPFGNAPEGLAERICREKERPPSQVNSKIPEVFDSICARSLAKSPGDRYSTAHEFADALRRGFESAFGAPPRGLLSNETVVSVFLSTLRGGPRSKRSSQPVARAVPKPASPPESQPGAAWADQTLRAVEKQLASFIGPLARVVVKNAAARATSLEDLYRLAAESLGSTQERKAFLAGHVPAGSESSVASSAPSLQDQSEAPTLTGHEVGSVPGFAEVKLKGVERPASPPPPVASAPQPKPSAEIQKPQPKSPKLEANVQSPPGEPELVASRLEELLGKQPQNLAGYLAEEPAEVDRVIYGFISATEALATLHAANGKSGGLTPQSIRFDRMGKASIRAAAATNQPGATSFGSMGSPRYAAPEIFEETKGEGSAPLVLSDIYALGFMFYEILLGRRLFQQTFAAQRNDLDWLRWHTDAKSTAPTLKSLLPGRSTALSELLQSMLEKDPAKRVSDLNKVLARLRSIAQQSSQTVVGRKLTAAAAAKAEPSGRPSNTFRTIGIVLAIAVLLGLLFWQGPALYRLIMPFVSHLTEILSHH